MARNRSDLFPPQQIVKHSDGKGGHVVVLPSPIVKRDLFDHAYTKDIDEKVLNMAMIVAEKLATSIVRETLGQQLEAITERVAEQLTKTIADKLPQQQVIIQQTTAQALPEIKNLVKDFEFKTDIAVDHTAGMTLKGKPKKIQKTNDTTDDTLDILDQLNL